ncbi:hypothetical protein BH11BAC6_BH11BAC6_14870 [soil metagenome]
MKPIIIVIVMSAIFMHCTFHNSSSKANSHQKNKSNVVSNDTTTANVSGKNILYTKLLNNY